MDYNIHITLWIVVRTAIILGVVYLLLRLTVGLLEGLQLAEETKQRLHSILTGITALYVPLALVILVVALILWQQRLIGIPALLSLILFYRPLSHFFQGLAVRAKGDLAVGTHIRIGDVSGDIQRWGTTELKVATRSGLVAIPYGQLFDQGYTIADHSQTAHYVELKAVKTSESRKDIADLIASSPYARLDTKVLLKNVDEEHILLRVVPRTDDFIDDIKDLLKDAQYDAVQVTKSPY